MPNKETEKKPHGSLFLFIFTIGGLGWFIAELWTSSIREKHIGCVMLIGLGGLYLLIRKSLSALIAEHQTKYPASSPWTRSLASYDYTLKLVTCGGLLMFLSGMALLLQMLIHHGH